MPLPDTAGTVADRSRLCYLRFMGPGRGKAGRLRRWLLILLGSVLVLVLLLLGTLLVLEWRPDSLMDTPVGGTGKANADPPAAFDLISWNIGYAGLGKDADFFMDGGDQVRPPDKSLMEQNLSAMRRYLRDHPTDVVLLQEVDRDASRSFGIDQVSALTSSLPDHWHSRAVNFRVAWIPYPLLDPIGRVESGLLSLSRFRPDQAIRHQLPGSYPWPVRVFHLKRCLHELRFAAPDGKDWVVIHLHLSAFDKDGRMRKEQMVYLKQLILDRKAGGHHVIVGGDWNQAFVGLGPRAFPHSAEVPAWFQEMQTDWTPAGWHWAFDKNVPSLRATNKPWVPGENFVTSVDGFLFSPELEVVSVQATDLGFTHSDHNPVRVQVKLRAEENEPADLP